MAYRHRSYKIQVRIPKSGLHNEAIDVEPYCAYHLVSMVDDYLGGNNTMLGGHMIGTRTAMPIIRYDMRH
jgi:hypothetical protein